MSLIEIKNLSFSYLEDSPTLQNVSLSIQKGEWVSILGHNGSGKSTLIRCINGLEQHHEGSIVVEGIELDNTLKNIDKI